jgi:hypothetical protein
MRTCEIPIQSNLAHPGVTPQSLATRASAPLPGRGAAVQPLGGCRAASGSHVPPGPHPRQPSQGPDAWRPTAPPRIEPRRWPLVHRARLAVEAPRGPEARAEADRGAGEGG